MILEIPKEDTAFFFFFSPGESPAYRDPRFQNFCKACNTIRHAHPSMTVGALRTLLTVAAWDPGGGLSYEDVARAADQEYIQALHHIELLSTGRRGHVGPELLIRREVEDSRSKLVTLSATGRTLARLFAYSDRDHPEFEHIAKEIKKGPLLALGEIHQRLPGISLGTLTVLLQVGIMQEEFGIYGVPAKRIAETLGISNMPRHLALLGDGVKKRGEPQFETARRAKTAPEKRLGYRVIQFVTSVDDARVKLPEMTPKGHTVLTEVARALCGGNVEIARRIKPEVLEALESPDDMDDLDESAFEDLYE